MDIRMPNLDGIEAIRRLPDQRVLVLTTFGLDEYIVEALRAGASGFIPKDVPAEELVRAVRVVAAGEALLTPAVTRQLLDRVARRLPAPVGARARALAELTEREREVFELLARGHVERRDRRALVVGDATVKTHVSNVLMKLGLRDRVQAVVLAYESGLFAPGSCATAEAEPRGSAALAGATGNRSGEPTTRATARRDACRAMTNLAHIIETEGADQALRRTRARSTTSTLDGPARLRLRLPRPQRRRQDDTIRMLLGLTAADARDDGGCAAAGAGGAGARRSPASARSSRSRTSTPTSPAARTCGCIAAVRGPRGRRRGSTARSRASGSASAPASGSRRYSQGMRQRLGVARCLLADPELLILDEPMNGLDPAGILEFRQMIRALVGEGRTVFLSSHLLDEVEKTCSDAAVIDRGRLIAAGPIAELLSGGRAELDIGCDDPRLALDLLDGHRAVAAARQTADGLRVDARRATTASRRSTPSLVGAGVAVFRLEPVRESLEQRFLEITSRIGGESMTPVDRTPDGRRRAAEAPAQPRR